jgi:hypothetical protein
VSQARVYIATTLGPVAIQRITEEDPEVNSVICLAGKAVSLPISGAYDAFVRNPTGVIQRDFGHAAFRVDVSEKIDEGYSWQLGVFTAHALQRSARLAGPDTPIDTLIIATGEVDRDLNLHVVDGVAEKIARLEETVDTLAAGAKQVLIAVPAGTEQPWLKAFSSAGVEVIAVANVHDLLLRLELTLPKTKQQEPPPPAPTPNRQGRVIALTAVLALAAMAATAGGVVYAPEIKTWVAELTEPTKLAEKAPTSPTPEPALSPTAAPAPTVTPKPIPVAVKPTPMPSKPPPLAEPKPIQKTPRAQESDRIETARLPNLRHTTVSFRIEELRAPPGYRCADVFNGRVIATRQPARRRAGGGYLPSTQENLCTLEISAKSDSQQTYLFGRYQRWTQTRPVDGPPDKVIDLGPRQGSVHWTVDIPERLRWGALFRIVIFSADHEYTPSQRILRKLNQVEPRSKRLQKITRRLRKRGIRMTTKRFRVIPERLIRDRRRRPPPPLHDRYPPPPRG